MLTQNDTERERYEARLKKLRDERSNLLGAEQRGVLIGHIQMCERMLKRAPTSFEELKSLRMEKLKELAAELAKQAFPVAGNGSV